MKKYLASFSLASYLFSTAVIANDCDPALPLATPNIQIALTEAQARLSSALLDVNQADSQLSVPASIEAIDCYLLSSSVDHDLLDSIRPALTESGRKLTNAPNIEQQRRAINDIRQKVMRDAGNGFVSLPSASQEIAEVDLFGLIKQHCGATPTEQCARATGLAENLWWIAGEYRGFANRFNQRDKQASLAFNQQLDERWRSYKDDTIKLWPHEVLLNSAVYQPRGDGLSSPPSHKLLALRPSLGLTYLSDQDHHIQPTLNLDLLGVYWWEYAGANASKAQPGRGIATTAVWDGSHVALGVTYHHNPRWSATIAHGSEDDLVVSVSFQLAYWFLRR